MLKMSKLIFSAEFFFAAFLLAGYFKGGIPWFPIDITIFCLIITLGLSSLKLLNNFKISKPSIKSIFLFLVFTTFILLSYSQTKSVNYANEKLLRYLIITSWSYLGVFVIIKSKKSLIKFFDSIVLISSIVSMVALYELVIRISSGTYVGTIFIMDTDYLALGRTVGLGLVILIATYWFGNQKNKILSIFMPILMTIVILFAGGRMPLIALVLSLLVMMILATSVNKNKKLVINKGVFKLVTLFGIAFLFLLPFYLNGTFDDFFWRIQSIFAGGDAGAFARLSLFRTANRMFQINPFLGTGWASFPLYYYGIDQKVYPHNIFIEIGSEMGIFALLSFVFFIAYALYIGIIKYKKVYGNFNNIQLAIIGGFVFFFLNANTSGDITDNKILFTFISLLTISKTYNKYEDFEKINLFSKNKRRKKRKIVWKKSKATIKPKNNMNTFKE